MQKDANNYSSVLRVTQKVSFFVSILFLFSFLSIIFYDIGESKVQKQLKNKIASSVTICIVLEDIVQKNAIECQCFISVVHSEVFFWKFIKLIAFWGEYISSFVNIS